MGINGGGSAYVVIIQGHPNNTQFKDMMSKSAERMRLCGFRQVHVKKGVKPIGGPFSYTDPSQHPRETSPQPNAIVVWVK
jgi:hypothetical protein